MTTVSYNNPAFGIDIDDNQYQPKRSTDSVKNYGSTDNNKKLDTLRKDVDDVKGIMLNNIEKTIQRDQNLDTLLIQSEELEASSNFFQRSSKALKKKMCCQSAKANTLLAGVILLLIALFVFIIVMSVKPWENK